MLFTVQAGPLLTRLAADWAAVVTGRTFTPPRLPGQSPAPAAPPPALQLFFAHDTTLTFLLDSLAVWDGRPPPYASALLAELHQAQPDTSQHSVRLGTLQRQRSIRAFTHSAELFPD